MLQQQEGGDYVIATGVQHSVRDFAEAAFDHVALDYRKYVVIDPQLIRPADVETLLGDASLAHEKLGWASGIGFTQLVQEMVEADLSHFSRLRR